MLRYCPAHDVHEGIIVLNIKKNQNIMKGQSKNRIVLEDYTHI